MKKQKNMSPRDRRDFIETAALGGGALFLFGNLGVMRLSRAEVEGRQTYKMILADYSKCTGCRTCETACSAANNKKTVNGESLDGLGNPHLASIRVHAYNPDVDVPITCAMCPDAPCVDVCPVAPDEKTGRKALYRDEKNQTIKNDPKRCEHCGECAGACRTGVIKINPDTYKPERMCTLCNGDPQCVKHCPYNALSHVVVDTNMDFYGKRPDQIAQALILKWYKINVLGK